MYCTEVGGVGGGGRKGGGGRRGRKGGGGGWEGAILTTYRVYVFLVHIVVEGFAVI